MSFLKCIFESITLEDSWEQRKLGDTVNSIVAGGDIDKSKIQENGKYPVYANALTNDGVIGYYNDQYRVKAPAVTVTGRGEIGVAKTRNTNFTPVVRLLAINSMHNNYFLENLINTHRAFAESTGVPQLTAPQLANYKLKFPKSIEEESKIGNFFNNLDSLITLHQRKLNKLKKLKSAYLTEMFPDEGEHKPKRRFAGFTDDWEQRKLGDMGNVITGNTPSTKDKSNWTTDKNKGHIWITPTDINRKVLFDSERYLSDKGWLKARKIPKNSVLITSIASIGKNAINGIDAAFNQQINALILQNNNYYFVLSLMDKEKKRFEALAGQTATPIINKSTFSSFQLQIPSENEQNKIGNFFKKIDNLITLHQRKIDKLQKLKNAYLNEMFV